MGRLRFMRYESGEAGGLGGGDASTLDDTPRAGTLAAIQVHTVHGSFLLLVCSLQFLLNFKSRLLLRTIQIQT